MKIHSVSASLFQTVGQTDRQTDRHRQKLITSASKVAYFTC